MNRSRPDISRLVAAGRAAFPSFTLRRLARTPSTQDVVRAAARSGMAEGYCCVAGEQTAGRGRLGHRWLAPPESALLVSILLRPSVTAVPGITIAAGLATIEAIETTTGVAPRLRWPNDVLVGGAKLAGILAESEDNGGASAPAIILGIGINLTVNRFPEGVTGSSLHRLIDPPPSWDDLLSHLLRSLSAALQRLESGGIPGLRDQWRRNSIGLGGPVRREGPAGPIVGTALDIDDSGALVVQGPGGELVRLIAGEVHFQSGPRVDRLGDG